MTRALLCSAVTLCIASAAVAQTPRVGAEGARPDDRRLQPLKDLDGYFPFEVPETAEAWNARRQALREHLLVALGLWPMPRTSPLNPVIHGRVEKDGYAIEKVYFESMPGFYVTGNLYRPLGVTGKVPGILCPHGHWSNGRFYDCGEDEVRRQVDSGAEWSLEGGRSPLQARCVQLARMGAIVFHYDMIGYADSVQIPQSLAHGFAKQRPEMNQETGWGLFSPRAESRLQSVMGLQTYNSMRALDFLESLDQVDSRRLAVTGASGGGTQTFMLAALDDRVSVAFPAVMVSTAMQGGCTCENCSLLRVGTGNVEIAAMFAPKPMGLTAADDWTKEMTTKGFPELQRLYALLGHPERVELTSRTEFGHNYNQVGRAAMYRLFQRELGLAAALEEREYERLTAPQLTVWDDAHPAPEGGDDFERRLLAHWDDDAKAQLAGKMPTDAASLAEFVALMGPAARVRLGRGLARPGDVEWELVDKQEHGDHLSMTGWIRRPRDGECLPAVFLYPNEWHGQVVLWFDGQGKDGLYDASGSLRDEVVRLLAAGHAVGGVDLLYQGEFLESGQMLTQTPKVANPRESAGYTFGYNPSVLAWQAQDVASIVGWVATDPDHEVEGIHVIATGDAGPIVAVATPAIAPVVDRIAIETGGFRFASVDDLRDPRFLPGGAKYFDLPGFLALGSATDLMIAGESQVPEVIAACYRAAGRPDAVRRVDGELPAAAVRWFTSSNR